MSTVLDVAIMATLVCLIIKRTRLLGIVGLVVILHYNTIAGFFLALAGAMIVGHYEDEG